MSPPMTLMKGTTFLVPTAYQSVIYHGLILLTLIKQLQSLHILYGLIILLLIQKMIIIMFPMSHTMTLMMIHQLLKHQLIFILIMPTISRMKNVLTHTQSFCMLLIYDYMKQKWLVPNSTSPIFWMYHSLHTWMLVIWQVQLVA